MEDDVQNPVYHAGWEQFRELFGPAKTGQSDIEALTGLQILEILEGICSDPFYTTEDLYLALRKDKVINVLLQPSNSLVWLLRRKSRPVL